MPPRAYLAPRHWGPDRATLPPDETHHLHRVLRLSAGDAIHLFDGEGRQVQARVESLEHGAATLRWTGDILHTPRPAPRIHLYPALLKSRGMDWLLEKATELGAAAITPLCTRRAVARPRSAQLEKQLARWQRIAISAAKQCGTPWLPALHPPLEFDDLLPAITPFDLFLAPLLRPGTRPLRDLLQPFDATPSPETIGVALGPEGDFTPEEEDALLAAGVHPVSLGPRVLRAETAALATLSALLLCLEPV